MKKSPYIIMLWMLLCLIAVFEFAPLLGLINLPCLHKNLIRTIFNSYLGPTSCLGGVLAYLLILPIKKRELIGTAIFGIFFELILRHYRPTIVASIVHYKPDIALFNQFLFLGPGLLTACLLAILWRTWQAYRLDNSDELNCCLETLFLSIVMPSLLCLSIPTTHQYYTYDPHLYALDSLWGVQASFIIAKFLRSETIYSKFMMLVYDYLPIWMMLAQILVYRWNIQQKKSHIPSFIPAIFFALIAVCGELSYSFLPAVGVELYCGTNSFPNGPWPAANMNPVPIEAPYYLHRNCMPSLHFSWILAVYYSLYRSKPIYRQVALLLVFLTVLSTFSVGCHYLIDLIMAVPFTMALLAITMPEAKKKTRLIGAIFGLASFSGWLCLFKYSITTALQHPTLTLTLLIATDLISFYLAHLMCQQAKKTDLPELPQQQSDIGQDSRQETPEKAEIEGQLTAQ